MLISRDLNPVTVRSIRPVTVRVVVRVLGVSWLPLQFNLKHIL